MNIKFSVINRTKFISLILLINLLLQSFSPLFFALPVYALEGSSEIEVVAVNSSESAEVLAEPTLVLTPTVTPELSPVPTSTVAPAFWTFESLQIGQEYVFGQNSEVKLTFTQLPSPAGKLKIAEISLSPEQVIETGAVSNQAYEITSDMVDGTFNYDLVLPIPESAQGQSVEVKFAEDISQLSSAEKVENTLTRTEAAVSVSKLNHLTIFVVVNPAVVSPAPSGAACVAAGADTGAGCFSTIQAAIDAALAGDTIKVYPGNYSETASGRTVLAGTSLAQGPYQFGLFFPNSKPGIKLVGVNSAGIPITDANSSELPVITTNATNSFGASGIWVEAADVVIQGFKIGDNASGNNKTIEVVADNFTLQYVKTVTSDGGSIYLNDWTTAADVIKSYHILDNQFTDGASVDISSGAGLTGLVTDREILRNTFDLKNYGWNGVSFNGSNTGVPWFVASVGGAVIKNNHFSNSNQYIRTRGDVDSSQFDWQSYWNDNTYDLKVVALKNAASFDLQDYSYTSGSYTFLNAKRIGSKIQEELDHSGVNNTLLVGAGTYKLASQIRISKGLTVIGEGETTVITKDDSVWTNSTGSKGYAPIMTVVSGSEVVKLENFVLTGAKNIAMSPSGTDYGHGLNVVSSTNVILKNITSKFNAAAGLIVNSSTVTAENLNTSGNGWYGVNVDKANSGDAVFTLTGTGTLAESVQIISDKTIGATVSAAGYYPTAIADTTQTVWTKDVSAPQISNLKYYKNGVLVSTPATTQIVVGNINELTYGADYQDVGSGLNRTAFVIWAATEAWGPVSNSHKCNWNGSPSTTSLNSSLSQTLTSVALSQCNPTYAWPSGKYIITHIVYDNVGNSSYNLGGSQRFIIDQAAPAVPTLVGPTDGGSVKSAGLILDWTDSVDPSSPVTYFYQSAYSSAVGANNALVSPIYTTSTGLNSQINAAGSADNLYYWQVKACDSLNNCSAWSGPWAIRIDSLAPSVPTNGLPNNTFLATNNFDFTWSNSTDVSPITYEFQSSLSSTAVGGILTTGLWKSGVLPTAMIHSSGAANGVWNWQVRAKDSAGNISAWSQIWKVTLDSLNPTIPAALSYSTLGGTVLGCNTITNQSSITAKWAASTDLNFSNYEYKSFNPTTGWVWNAGNIGNTLFRSGAFSAGEGTYGFALRAKDLAGNYSAWTANDLAGSCRITYDATAPLVMSVTSDGQIYNLASSNPTIKVTFSEVLAVTPVIEIASPVLSAQTVTDCADGDAKTFCFDYSLVDEETDHTLYISAGSDLAGNVMALDATHNFRVDRVAPVLASKTSFSGWYNANQISSFSYVGGISDDPTCEITTQGVSQTCEVTPNICDLNGNCNTTPVTSNGANIDFTKPVSTITAPINSGSGSVIYANNWTGSILGTASDDLSGTTGVYISIQNAANEYFDGSNFISGNEILLTATYSAGDWSYLGLTSPTEGSYLIKSHALDLSGNLESSYSLTVIFDKTIPEVALTINPADPDASNGWYKTQPEVALTATDSHIAQIEYQWDSQVGGWTTYTNSFKPATEAAHTLYYRALDLAGNYSEIGIKTVNWDKTELTDGPLNLSVSPNPTSGSTSLVKWTEAKDNLGIAKYEIIWSLKNSDKSYSSTVGSEVREFTINNLTEGIWNVRVTAFDGAGNTKSNSLDLTVDRTSPNAPTLTVLGTATGEVSLSWSKIADAQNYVIWYGTTPGTYLYGANVGDVQAYTVRSLGAGGYYFIVKAVDNSGNQSSNSNEVSSGLIAGAPGVAEGQAAQDFTPEVKGVSIEVTPTLSPTLGSMPEVLGTTTESIQNWLKSWWWLLGLAFPIYLLWRYFNRKSR